MDEQSHFIGGSKIHGYELQRDEVPAHNYVTEDYDEVIHIPEVMSYDPCLWFEEVQ